SLIFPRSGGTIDAAFNVKSSVCAPIALGSVRYIGDPSAKSFAFLSAQQCPSGTDSMGAICVDDSPVSSTCTGQTAKGLADSDGPDGDEGGTQRSSALGSGAMAQSAAIAQRNLPLDVGTDGDGDSGGDGD